MTSALNNSEILQMTIIERVLHSGSVGIAVLLVIVLSAILCIITNRQRKDIASLGLAFIPIILGVLFYAYCISFVIIEFLYMGGVADPNWYFHMTSDAALFMLFGGFTSLALIGMNVITSFKTRI